MNKIEREQNVITSNHECNMNNDRHAQNRLLEIDDQLDLTDYMIEFKGYTDIKVPKTIKVTKNDEILGWFSSSKCNLRKPEKEKQNTQPVNSYSWREQTRLKNLIQDSFNFKHYPYSKAYIEQYREENSQISGIRSPIVRETNEPKRVGLQNAAPSPSTQTGLYNSGQNLCNHCNQPTNPPSQNLITAAFNYTRREPTSLGNGACKCNHNQIHSGYSSHTCSKHNHHHHKDAASQAYKYKLTRDHAMMPNVAWKSEPELIEIDKETRTPRVLSGKRSAGKSPTKVTVPSLPNGHSKNIQTVTVQQLSQGRPGSDGANNLTQPQNLRALDALTCIASEKQRKTRPYSTVQVRALGHILMDTIKGVGIKRPDSGMMYSTMDFSRSKSENIKGDSPSTEGLTWLEKMELLRSVNRKKEKPKEKQPKLTYIKDSPPDGKNLKKIIENKGDNLTSLSAQGQTNSQLFEQRRIKHLLQQAKMKRNTVFDWLTDSPRYRHSLDSSKDESSDESTYSDSEDIIRTKSPKCFSPGMDVGHAESTLLSRYNIKPFVKGGGWKVTPMTMQRARTIVYED